MIFIIKSVNAYFNDAVIDVFWHNHIATRKYEI